MAGSSVIILLDEITVIKKITFTWVSDDTTGGVSGVTTFSVSGKLFRITTIPGAGGVAPDPNYDITLKDSDGVDILQGLGVDRHTSNTQDVPLVYLATSIPPVSKGLLTFAVVNAGNSNEGVAIIYYESG